MSALDLLDNAIAELEARLHLRPGEAPRGVSSGSSRFNNNNNDKPIKQQQPKQQPKKVNKAATTRTATANDDVDEEGQPDICKLEFKVGVITKVWVHEKADKLYCEEIDVGEATPRQIASGLRPHFTQEQMLGQRLLVVANLKAKNLVGFKSHGMVLCAAAETANGDGGKVEFVEPPEDAVIGEVVTFDGLPPPRPISAAQVEKKKIFQTCMPGMKTTEDCIAAWNGHCFITSAGPCRTKTIAGGCLR